MCVIVQTLKKHSFVSSVLGMWWLNLGAEILIWSREKERRA